MIFNKLLSMQMLYMFEMLIFKTLNVMIEALRNFAIESIVMVNVRKLRLKNGVKKRAVIAERILAKKNTYPAQLVKLGMKQK